MHALVELSMYYSLFSLLCVQWQPEAIDVKKISTSVGVNTLNVSSSVYLMALQSLLISLASQHIQRKNDSYIHLLKCVFYHCQAAKKEKNNLYPGDQPGLYLVLVPFMPFHKVTWRGGL